MDFFTFSSSSAISKAPPPTPTPATAPPAVVPAKQSQTITKSIPAVVPEPAKQRATTTLNNNKPRYVHLGKSTETAIVSSFVGGIWLAYFFLSFLFILYFAVPAARLRNLPTNIFLFSLLSGVPALMLIRAVILDAAVGY